ncbi:MAG TPA: GTP-binding protein [Gaiellaceae bacterium]|nr:GTP-binding protein [Gaiellaceae bacterium]
MSEPSPKTPVALLTGFLGSGKTTLLSRLLAHPGMGETAVIVNELGEVAIDHHLLRRVDERTVLLKSGCVCCSLRGDLADELRDLLGRRERGEIPAFRRVVVETTGLADPAPILYTLLSEPVVKHHFRVERVIATVDAVNGLPEPESVRQVAAADTLVVTKTDLDEATEVRSALEQLNPTATVFEVSFGDVEPGVLFGPAGAGLRPVPMGDGAEHSEVRACSIFLDAELDWGAFGIWLTMLLQSRGNDILRVKGLLNVGGPGPVLVNGVQHVVHPPEHLEAWPDDDLRSRIVFIGRGFTPDELSASLLAFNAAAG